MSKRHLEREN